MPSREIGPGVMLNKFKNFLMLLGAAAFIFLMVYVVWPRVKPLLDSASTFSVAEVTSEEAAEVSIDFSTAILTESRQQQTLVVLEQDAEGETTISSAMFGWDIFKKTDVIRSYGTGVYTVDLQSLSTSSVTVDDEAKTVTVRIPHACLSYINVDTSKSEVVSSERGLLAFGDLTLTQEQQSELESAANEAIRAVLTTSESYAAADAAALEAAFNVFDPIVASLSIDYELVIEFDKGTTNEDLTSSSE